MLALGPKLKLSPKPRCPGIPMGTSPLTIGLPSDEEDSNGLPIEEPAGLPKDLGMFIAPPNDGGIVTGLPKDWGWPMGLPNECGLELSIGWDMPIDRCIPII